MSFKCNYGMSNTGTGCVPIWRVTKKILLVPYFNSANTINTIDTTQTLDKTFFDALINQADLSKRVFPIPFMKNVTTDRGESQKETFDDGSVIIINQGVRKFVGLIVERDATPQLLGKLKSARSLPMGFYAIDKDGNLIGMQDPTTAKNLNPIRLDENSVDPVYNPSTDKKSQNIALMFDIHVNELDENLRAVTREEMGYDVGLMQGLLDITPKFTNLLASGGFTVELDTDFGTMINPLTDKGLVAADFALKNITTNAAIVITSVTEQTDSVTGAPKGIYDFVFPAQTANDVIRLTPTKAGRDYSKVIAARPVLL